MSQTFFWVNGIIILLLNIIFLSQWFDFPPRLYFCGFSLLSFLRLFNCISLKSLFSVLIFFLYNFRLQKYTWRTSSFHRHLENWVANCFILCLRDAHEWLNHGLLFFFLFLLLLWVILRRHLSATCVIISENSFTALSTSQNDLAVNFCKIFFYIGGSCNASVNLSLELSSQMYLVGNGFVGALACFT